jgi:predicted house-cleaning noncanonical NTP pyrophosphatase (MazG superfamily)
MATKRFLIDKLGRDKMVEVYEARGSKLKFHIVEDNEEYLDVLTQKLVEELEEVFDSESKEEAIKELADFEEVFSALKNLLSIDQKDIDAARKKKLEERGGFAKRLYMEYLDTPEGSEDYKYCLKNEEKYPEILEGDE